MKLIPILCMILTLSGTVSAQNKKLNTQLFEQEQAAETTSSFTAKVRVVREISDEVEVFFDSDQAKGAYTLPHGTANHGTMLKKLEDSRKAGGGVVTVTADEDKRILTVEAAAKNRPANKSKNPYDPGTIPDF